MIAVTPANLSLLLPLLMNLCPSEVNWWYVVLRVSVRKRTSSFLLRSKVRTDWCFSISAIPCTFCVPILKGCPYGKGGGATAGGVAFFCLPICSGLSMRVLKRYEFRTPVWRLLLTAFKGTPPFTSALPDASGNIGPPTLLRQRRKSCRRRRLERAPKPRGWTEEGGGGVIHSSSPGCPGPGVPRGGGVGLSFCEFVGGRKGRLAEKWRSGLRV